MDLSLGTRRDITKKYAADYAKSSKTFKAVILDELVHCAPTSAPPPANILSRHTGYDANLGLPANRGQLIRRLVRAEIYLW
jgi:hypothetical protein